MSSEFACRMGTADNACFRGGLSANARRRQAFRGYARRVPSDALWTHRALQARLTQAYLAAGEELAKLQREGRGLRPP